MMTKRSIFLGVVLVLMLGIVPVASAQGDQPGQEDGPEEEQGSAFCGDQTAEHPVGASIAARYGVSYEEVMGWFCPDEGGDEGGGKSYFGFGEIMLALQTSQLTGDDPDELLLQRSEGSGWGQIWRTLGLIGRPEDAVPPGHANRPDHAGGPPEGEQHGNAPDCPGAAGQSGGGHGRGQGRGQGSPPGCS